MTDPIIGRFEIAKYDDTPAITIANFIENTWLTS